MKFFYLTGEPITDTIKILIYISIAWFILVYLFMAFINGNPTEEDGEKNLENSIITFILPIGILFMLTVMFSNFFSKVMKYWTHIDIGDDNIL